MLNLLPFLLLLADPSVTAPPPIAIDFSKQEKGPQREKLIVDLKGHELKDVRMDLRLVGVKTDGPGVVEGVKIGKKAVFKAKSHYKTDPPIEIECVFGSLGPDSPMLNISVFMTVDGRRVRVEPGDIQKKYVVKINKEISDCKAALNGIKETHKAEIEKLSKYTRGLASQGVSEVEVSAIYRRERDALDARIDALPEKMKRRIDELTARKEGMQNSSKLIDSLSQASLTFSMSSDHGVAIAGGK